MDTLPYAPLFGTLALALLWSALFTAVDAARLQLKGTLRTVEDARKQWVAAFGRDRADLGPAHARRQAIDSIDRYGPQARRRPMPEPLPHSPARDGSLSI